MVGKRPNHAESALIALAKVCGYKEGKVTKTYVKWKKRSLKRAARETGDFYANCMWGPFKGGGPYELDLVFLNLEDKGVDFEIDGAHWHKEPEQIERDAKRDDVLRANGWVVVRIPDTLLYSKLVPLLNSDLSGLVKVKSVEN
jgi:hypothetical protein